ncbi:MAG TPA: ABC transporter ATP-binding protein [Kofleriaceae bacterium]|nr:ABC transporter ATP-binding protein [Kofleriaceae bacterium]
MGDALIVDNVTVRFASRVAVANASFTAAHGAVTAILGPNGAGKTTLLRAIAGLAAYEGTIWVGGVDVNRLPLRARARHIGYVPQQSRLDSPLSAFEVVAQGRYTYAQGVGRSSATDHDAIEDALRRADALDFADRSFVELSHGQRKRVLIARALATGARLVLFDEPTASLDIGHVLAFFRLARELAAAGTAVVVVLHDLDEARRHCDGAVLLQAGSVAARGLVADVITRDPVRKVYGIELVPGDALGFREVT